MNNEDIFIDIIGYEKEYSINKKGQIFSKSKNRIMNQWIANNGYLTITFRSNKNKKTYLIHRLLAEHFIKNPENKTQINHKNGIKTDNRLENLEWVTVSENCKHAYNMGLSFKNPEHIKYTKEKCSKLGKLSRKLSIEDVNNIKQKYGTGLYSQRKLAELYNLTQGTISALLLNKTYKEFNYAR